MVLVTGGYAPVGPNFYGGLRDLLITVVHQTPRGNHPALYNLMSFLAKCLRYETGWHTQKNVVGETN